MFPNRWHHGHSITTGFIGGLAFAGYRIWLMLGVAFLLGCLLTIAVVNSRRLIGWVGRRWA